MSYVVQNQQDYNHGRNFGMWVGAGIGGAVGGGIACFFMNRRQKKLQKLQEEAAQKARKAAYSRGRQDGLDANIDKLVRSAKENGDQEIENELIKKAYDQGVADAMAESEKWIAEHMIIVDADDPDGAKKTIDEQISKIAAENLENSEKKPDSVGNLEENGKGSAGGEVKGFEVTASLAEKAVFAGRDAEFGRKMTPEETEDDLIFAVGPEGEKLKYPKALFFNRNGEPLSEIMQRENVRNYERDPGRLRKLWMALGWGAYIPDPEGLPEDEDINNWDLNIDDDEGKMLGDEPEERTRQREVYMNELRKYSMNPAAGEPRIITRREYEEECHLEKITVDYYAGDNTFVENEDFNHPIDAVTLFGVSNGNDLFAAKPPFTEEENGGPDDPDIVYVKNFAMNTVAEITRDKRSFESVRDGSAYFESADQD